MNIRRLTILLLITAFGIAAEGRWKIVDEGFRLMLPFDWKKIEVRGIDSHVGEYRGKTAYLQFDELFGLGYTVENSDSFIEQLKKKERNPSALKEGEEVWRVDGRIALFTIGKVDPHIYGKREFQNIATLSLSYEGLDGGLGIKVFFSSEDDVEVVRRILRSLVWPKKESNKQ